MPTLDPDEQLRRFYIGEYDESARLIAPYNQLELLRTRELLAGLLEPPPARILDVGGATGIHAAWLAQNGYDVDLVDPVEDHVRRAQAAARQLDRPFSAAHGDARQLDAADGSYDAVLLLGPLYHLQRQDERLTALREAVRVARPGAVVAAAAISRFAWPLYELRDGTDVTDTQHEAIVQTMASGVGDPRGNLPNAFSHRPNELRQEMIESGLIDVSIVGVEGPGWVLFNPSSAGSEATSVVLRSALTAARLADGEPEMAAMSAHLLGSGRTAA